MKKIFCFLFLFSFLKSFSQAGQPPGYQFRNSKDEILEIKARNTFHIPAGGVAPTLYGGWDGAGAEYWDSIGKKLIVWDGAKWDTIGSGGTGTLSGVTTPTQRHSIVSDTARYESYPVCVWSTNKDTVWCIWRRYTQHAGDGPIMWARTIDGGSTWTVPDSIRMNAFGAGHVITGENVDAVYSNGRVCIAWITNATSYGSTKFGYTDNGGTTWNFSDSVNATATQSHVSNYGSRGVKTVEGVLLIPGYAWNVGLDSSYSFLYKSTDNGLTWTVGPTILATKTDGSFPQGDQGEAVVDIVSRGATDATTSFISFIRSNHVNGYHYQLYSTGGYTTWVNATANQSKWAFDNKNGVASNTGFPVTTYNDGKYLYVFVCTRATDNAQGYQVQIFKNIALNCYQTADSWGKPVAHVYRSLAYWTTSEYHWGYGSPFPTQTNDLKMVFYDPSPNNKSNDGVSSPSMKINLKAIPILGNNYYESYGTANQGISTATETAVTTGTVRWFDSENFYNSDSSKIYLPTDGFYQIYAKFQCDTSSLGTYREAFLYLREPGVQFSSFASGVSQDMLVSKIIRQPSTNPEFCYFELSGLIYGYKGQEVLLTFKHDKGSSLNILNSSSGYYPDWKTNATIRIKKIN